MLIPIGVALFDSNGNKFPLQLQHSDEFPETDCILVLTESTETACFTNITQKPVLSFLRDFSAPVKVIQSEQTSEDLQLLMRAEDDPYAKWNACETLKNRVIFQIIDQLQKKQTPTIDPLFLQGYSVVLFDKTIKIDLKVSMLTLPTPNQFFDNHARHIEDTDTIKLAIKILTQAILSQHEDHFLDIYCDFLGFNRSWTDIIDIDDEFTPERSEKRSLRKMVLDMLMHIPKYEEMCSQQYYSSRNMDNILSAFMPLVTYPEYEHRRNELFRDFRARWQKNSLVMRHWLRAITKIDSSDTLNEIQDFLNESGSEPSFDFDNPDNIRCLIGGLTANSILFHEPSGKAYQFLADFVIQLDRKNPSLAADLVDPLTDTTGHITERKMRMQLELKRIFDTPGISDNVHEKVQNALSASETSEVLLEEKKKMVDSARHDSGMFVPFGSRRSKRSSTDEAFADKALHC